MEEKEVKEQVYLAMGGFVRFIPYGGLRHPV